MVEMIVWDPNGEGAFDLAFEVFGSKLWTWGDEEKPSHRFLRSNQIYAKHTAI